MNYPRTSRFAILRLASCKISMLTALTFLAMIAKWRAVLPPWKSWIDVQAPKVSNIRVGSALSQGWKLQLENYKVIIWIKQVALIHRFTNFLPGGTAQRLFFGEKIWMQLENWSQLDTLNRLIHEGSLIMVILRKVLCNIIGFKFNEIFLLKANLRSFLCRWRKN